MIVGSLPCLTLSRAECPEADRLVPSWGIFVRPEWWSDDSGGTADHPPPPARPPAPPPRARLLLGLVPGLERGDHVRVGERRRVAERPALGDVAQETPHDLARARLRELG